MSHADAYRNREIRYLEDPIATTELCRFSLMCRHVCPVGDRTHQEALTPHGWALLIASVRRNMLDWNAETVDVLYKCADCGLCQAHCATSQPLPTAIAAARTEVVAAGLAPVRVLELDEALNRWENPYREEHPLAPSGKGDIALFVGDAAAHLEPKTLESALRLLRSAGVDPVLIGRGRSSGFLPSSLGLSQTAGRLAERNLAEISGSGCRTLLVLTPGDWYAFSNLYLERLNRPLPRDVHLRLLPRFLDELAQQGRLRFRPGTPLGAFAYHDPCHTPRLPDEHPAPRRLLSAVWAQDPAPLFWRGRRAHPCGAVGGLDFVQPDLASELARARLEDAAGAKAQVLVTEDPLCLHHLRKVNQSSLNVLGLYELLAENTEH